MATSRRDIGPGKEKAPPTPVRSTRSSASASASASASTSHSKLRPATRPPTAATDVSKHLVKKPSSAHGPAATKPLERKTTTPSVTLSQTQKATTAQKTTATRPSINPPLRPSSSSAKTVASQKPVQDKEKNVRALSVKDVGKYQSMHAQPVSAVKKVGTDVKKQGTLKTASAMNIKKQGSRNTTTSAIKGRISSASSVPVHEKVEHRNAPEVKRYDQEMFLTEMDDATEEYLQSYNDKGTDEYLQSYNDKGTDDFLVLAGTNDKDAKIMTANCSMGSEHQDVPVGIDTEVAENKPLIEEAKNEQYELEEHTVHEIPSINTVESVVYNTEGAKDEAVEEANGLNKKETAPASGSEAHEFQETEGGAVEEKKQEPENEAPMKVTVEKNKQESAKQEIVNDKKQELENESPKQGILLEKKQESENALAKQETVDEKPESENALPKLVEKKQKPENAAPRLHGKKDGSQVSNDEIEETAIKLREQRKNKVQALARAFESVIASQEK